MDFLETALRAHCEWKVKLLAAVGGGTTTPDRAQVCADDRCDLGRWLRADGRLAHGSRREFAALIEAHRAFHQSCADVVDLVTAGRREEAKQAIVSGAFAARSREVTRAIGQLRTCLARAGAAGASAPSA